MISLNTTPELSVVIPTYNEAVNIKILLTRLTALLDDINYEIIVVDDNSPDNTRGIVADIAASNSRIKLIRRLTDKGLSRAVVAGMLESTGSAIAVMDADMQHDESILPRMFQKISEQEFEICIGSREAEGGSYGEWSNIRKIVSYSAKHLARLTVGSKVKDPISGFFMISRDYFESTIDRINPSGFKILLEFIARGDAPKITEIGYVFRTRKHGETKISSTIVVEYILALIDLRFGWLIPNRFVKFGLVGITGSLVNLIGFGVAKSLGFSIPLSVIFGVECAILWTYFGNNKFTFTPHKFTGKFFFKGLLIYQLVSVYGLVIQLSVVSTMLSYYPFMGVSVITLYMVYLVGVCFAAIGNYFLHTYYTWNLLGFRFMRPTRSSA